MWLFPWWGRRVRQGSRSCAFPCRLGEMGCRGPRGAEWRGDGGYYREQIARISQAERRPRGLSCSEIKPLISIQRKAEEGASSSSLLCFPFPSATPNPTPLTTTTHPNTPRNTPTSHTHSISHRQVDWHSSLLKAFSCFNQVGFNTSVSSHPELSSFFFFFSKYHFSQFFYTNAVLSSDNSANGAFLWARWLDAFV